MSSFELKLNVFGFDRQVRAQLEKNFTKAGIYFASQMRGYLNRSQSYRKDGKRYTGLAPSAPGEFPKKLTGQLQKSITWELDKRKLVLTVGSNLRGYPSYLQKGTGRMKPRPWLTLSWAKDQDRIGKLLTGGR
jgi:hypothetical protein